MIEGPWAVFGIGCLGGVLSELLHWWNLRTKPEWPAYAKLTTYWALTLGMVVAGGAITWLYFGEQVEGILGLHVGLSTPLLLQKLVASVPEAPGVKPLAPRHSMKSFFKW